MGRKPSSIFDERIVADEAERGILSVHLKRYVFTSEFVRGKHVLDVACGTGYGAHYLSDFAARVHAVDLSEEAIAYAKERYQKPNLEFQAMDACRLVFPPNIFDAVVSFETIEHLNDLKGYLTGIANVLKPSGSYFVSTPCAKESTETPENPFHRQEWCPGDFRNLLEVYFESVKLFGGRRKQTALHRFLQSIDLFGLRRIVHFRPLAQSLSRALGTTPFTEMSLEDLEIAKDDFNHASWLLGVCSGPKKIWNVP